MQRPRRYVIIGNGVCGTTAAETLRKNDPQASIILIDDEPYPLYNRIALPRVLKLTTAPEKTVIRTVEFHQQHRLDLHLQTVVDSVDTAGRVVYTADRQEFPYDKLLVASGGHPNALPAPGAEGTGGIYNFQTLDDTKAIMARALEAKHCVVVGGSFIAYELAEGFRYRGLPTTWLMRGPRFLHRIIEEEGGQIVDKLAREVGVDTHYYEQVAEVGRNNGTVGAVSTQSGKRFDCDLLGVGVGLELCKRFLADTPVQTKYGILTNQFLETNVPDVYAGGDAAEFYDVHTEGYNQMGTWNNASAHGRVAATNMLGGRQAYEEVPYYTSTMFESQIAAIGTTPDVRPDMESLVRADHDARIYRRLFFITERLAGAVLIGDIKVRRQLIDLIKNRMPLSPQEKQQLIQV